jgi:predicted MFS family arabinose efflux permease
MRDRDFLKMFVSEGSAGMGSQVSLLALPLTAIVLLHAVPVLVAGWFLRALATPFYGVNQVSLRLAITPPALLARMTATMKFFVMGAMPLGSFLGGALAGSLGSRSTLWLIAGVSGLSVLAVAATGLREVSTPPEELRPEVAVAFSPG